jgi:hypothetical protein
VAELGAAFRRFIKFAMLQGVISDTEAQEYIAEQWEGLLSLLGDQAKIQTETDPAQRFLCLLRAVLASGRAYLASPLGTPPGGFESACGWIFLAGERGGWFPASQSTPKIGWHDGSYVYLEREATMAAVQQLAATQKSPLGEAKPVWSRLAESSVLMPSKGL